MERMIGETTNLSRNLKYIILQPTWMIWQKFGRWQRHPWPSYKPSAKNSKHVIKKGKIARAMQKLRKEHEQKFGISCGFQFQIVLNSKVKNLTCPIVAAKTKQVINVHMNVLFHKANVYFLFNNKKFAEVELPEAKTLRLLSQCHQMANLGL